MSTRYQGGYLRCVKRRDGSRCWEFLWREIGPTGKQWRRTLRVGSLEEYPTRELAASAVNGLRMCINAERHRLQQQPIQMSELIDHYILTELSEKVSWHSAATRIIYREFLELWIKPYWAQRIFERCALSQWSTGSANCSVRIRSHFATRPGRRYVA